MQNYKLPKILFLSFFLLVFIFSIFFSNEILTSLGLLLLFLVILVFIFNPQIGLFFLIILRINLDYFRDWEVFTIRDLFSLNFGALFGVFILIFVFYWIIVKKTNILKISNSLPIILFLIISLISIFYSGYQFLSLKEWIRIASFFAIYFLTFNLIKSKKSFPLIQKTFFISAIIPSLLGFWQILKNTGLRDDAGFLRIYGSFAHPNAFSYFLIIILTLLVYSFILEQNKKIKKYYLIF
ncbi:hypothetical protein KKH16_01330, partial [Patescibacteria group bacterium]|nr:hypothetical protein [Patescibacteria group bacterium]